MTENKALRPANETPLARRCEFEDDSGFDKRKKIIDAPESILQCDKHTAHTRRTTINARPASNAVNTHRYTHTPTFRHTDFTAVILHTPDWRAKNFTRVNSTNQCEQTLEC
jgi:hypothetical protein